MRKTSAAAAVVVSVWAGMVTGAPAMAGPVALPGGSVKVDFAGNLDFDGKPGFANVVTVTKAGTIVTIDDKYPITVSGACVHPVPADTTLAQCTVAAISPDVKIEPGALGDQVTIVGGGSVNWLIGPGEGDDTVDLTGSEGGATVAAGDGEDLIISSVYGETIDGDGGLDTVSYATHPGAVTVDLAAGQGGPEMDDLVAVENVIGGPGGDTLIGDGAANTLTGGRGNDQLGGAGGNDTLVGGGGTDTMLGGTGLDTVSYADHHKAVTASLDGVANDGSSGENDAIGADVENLIGGLGDDVLSGNDAQNVLHGDPIGNGNIVAFTGGDDTIYPHGGHDASYGLGGDDTIIDSWGFDSLYGGFGDDSLSGGGDSDTLYGQHGSDTLHGDGGFDALDGGTDSDWCYTDAGGGTKVNCEFPLSYTG